jgi:hypothetical protein
MLAIALNEDELLQLKLLLRDIELIQKLNKVFDYNAIEILSFKVIEHLNNEEDFMPKIKEIAEEEISQEAKKHADRTNTAFTSNWIDRNNGFIIGANWYKEQLKK